MPAALQNYQPAAEPIFFPSYELERPMLLEKPTDVPGAQIAYNPSGIWTIPSKEPGSGSDILYVRVEPDRSNPGTSHLGKSVARPYKVDLSKARPVLKPFSEAPTIRGEDPSLTRIRRRLPVSGKLEDVWLLSVVDPRPEPDHPDRVRTLCTRFYVGRALYNLEHVTDGPEWMKDIRIAPDYDPESSEIHVYGRPQPQSFSGNITYTKISGIEELNAETIAVAPFIDEELLPIGSGVWGGVNDVIPVAPARNILASHRAWCVDETGNRITKPDSGNSRMRHYEGVLYGHDLQRGTIRELGLVITAGMFPPGKVKDDAALDLRDVHFTGGGYNGAISHLTSGLSDGNIGFSKLRLTG
ncbi:MAG: DUF1861 family protein [bacterium]|nr:DUF1861 family protein [bacterium]